MAKALRVLSEPPWAPTELEHDPEKWVPVFGKRSCSSNKLEQDDDSKKSHPALAHPLSGSASEGSERRSPGTLGREVPGLLYPGSPLIPG